MQQQEGVARKLCKFQGKRTPPNYASDIHCVALRAHVEADIRAGTGRPGSVRSVTSASEIIAEILFLSQRTLV